MDDVYFISMNQLEELDLSTLKIISAYITYESKHHIYILQQPISWLVH